MLDVHHEPALDPTAVDSDGLLVDIEMMDLDPGRSRKDATRDVDAFFGGSFEREGSNGKIRKHQNCKIWCIVWFVIIVNPSNNFHYSKITLIADCLTAHRHIAFKHKVTFVQLLHMYLLISCHGKREYYKWTKSNHFESKLADDVAKRKKEALKAEERQSTLDPHLRELPPKKRIIPYSHKLLCEAAIEWLVETNQVHSFYLSIMASPHLVYFSQSKR